MKQYIITVATAVAMFAVGCTKDADVTLPATDGTDSVVPMNITLTGEQTTRTDFLKNTVLWSDGDMLGVFSPEAYYEWKMGDNLFYNKPVQNICMTVASGAGTPAAMFGIAPIYSGEIPEYTGRWGWNTATTDSEVHFYMYYPYQQAAKAATKPTAVPFTLPSVQPQAGSNDTSRFGQYDFVYAASQMSVPDTATEKGVVEGEMLFDFEHTFAVLKVTLSNYTAGAVDFKGVKLVAGDGQPLCGNFVVDITSGTVTAGKSIDGSGTVVDAVAASEVRADFDEPQTVARYSSAVVYIFVNPVDLTASETNTFTVYTSAGCEQFSFKASKAFEAGKIYTKTLQVRTLAELPTVTVDFESAAASDLAGPTIAGENLYSTYTGGKPFVSYTDATTGLKIGLNNYADYSGTTAPSLYGGGMFLSQWNDLTTESYANQCSVYYKDATTGKGGCDGSATFVVGYGYDGTAYSYGSDTRAAIELVGSVTTATVKSLWICNTTYAYLSMTSGDDFAKKHSYDDKDFFRVVAIGYTADGTKTGEAECYLSDFRTTDATGIAKGWQKFDLTSLGVVHKIVFNCQSSDVGEYGMNTPAYYAIDNIELQGEF